MLVASASGDSLTVMVSPLEKEITDPPIFWSCTEQMPSGLMYAILSGLSGSFGWTFKRIITRLHRKIMRLPASQAQRDNDPTGNQNVPDEQKTKHFFQITPPLATMKNRRETQGSFGTTIRENAHNPVASNLK
jgi:hypothetical protein